MTIRIEAYDRLPDAARAIREQVFIRERDWRPEFDEWDAASAHLLAFDSVDSPDRPGPSAQSASPIQSGQPDQPGRYIICIASMFVGRVRQCFSAVWADGFPRCRHRFPVM